MHTTLRRIVRPTLTAAAVLAAASSPAAAGGVSGAAGSGGAGSAATLLDPGVEAMLAAMQSDDLAVRERAADRLEARGVDRARTLLGLLERSDLTPEQRARVRHLAHDTMLQLKPRGLGVRFVGARLGVVPRLPDRLSVTIDETLPGFPASGVLRPKDEVLSVAGQPLRGTPHFQRVILGRLPGESLPMVVLRPQDPAGVLVGPVDAGDEVATTEIELDVPLGDYEDLGQAVPREPHSDGVQMRIAEAEEGGDGVRVIGSGLGAEAWLRAEGLWLGMTDDGGDSAGPAVDGSGVAVDAVPAGTVLRLGGQAPGATAQVEMFRSSPEVQGMLDEPLMGGRDSVSSALEFFAAYYRDRVREYVQSEDVLQRLQIQRQGNARAMAGQREQRQRLQLQEIRAVGVAIRLADSERGLAASADSGDAPADADRGID